MLAGKSRGPCAVVNRKQHPSRSTVDSDQAVGEYCADSSGAMISTSESSR